MVNESSNNHWVVYVSVLLAFLLQLFFYFCGAKFLVPPLLSLVLLYWILAFPQHFGLLFAFVVGLVVDVAQGQTLGINAIAFILLAYAVLAVNQRLRNFSPWRQAATIFFILGIQLMLVNWVQALEGRPVKAYMILLPAFIGALAWPATSHYLRLLRRRLQVG